MNHHHEPINGEDRPPAGPEPVPHEPGIQTPFESRPPGRRPAAYIAVAVGLAAMAAGAVFFARSLSSTGGGADTPAAAVQRMFDALSDEDALGVLETLLPSERDSLRRPLQDLTRELSRLGVLSADVDLGSISGLDLQFSDLRFDAERLSPDVASVAVTSGVLRYRVDPARAPLGDFVRDLLPPEALRPVEGSDTAGDALFATVRSGGRWYVSLWYSLAEAARRDAGAPVPAFGDGLPARGAGTPERAVEDLIRAAAALDVRRLIELMPPTEARALHDYAPLFIVGAEEAARQARSAYDADIDAIELEASGAGDRSVVKIRKLAFAVTLPELNSSLSYDGRCATLRGPVFGAERPVRVCGQGIAPVAGLPSIAQPDTGFVTVREGGQWFVSPTGTVLDGLLGITRVLERSHLDAFNRLFREFLGM